MTITEMFGQSAILSLVGMGTVFLFLAILILCVSIVARIVKALKWDKDLYAVAEQASPAQALDGSKPAIVAAISAAIHKHRAKDNG